MIIGLYSNAPQSGKSTFADYLEDEFEHAGKVVRRLAFADIIKDMTERILTTCYDVRWAEVSNYVRGNKKDVQVAPKTGEHEITSRRIQQVLGTEIGRNIDKDIWVKYINRSIEKISTYYPEDRVVFIIDDMRFMNEFDYIHSDGYTININRGFEYSGSHVSEGALKDCEFRFNVQNYGDLETLKGMAKELAEIIMYEEENGDTGKQL